MKKKEILEYIEKDFASEKQIEFIYNLLCLPTFCNKLDLLKLADKNPRGMNFDTAYPIDLYKAINTIYKDIYNANLIFDYTENNFGTLVNINNLVVTNILNLKR